MLHNKPVHLPLKSKYFDSDKDCKLSAHVDTGKHVLSIDLLMNEFGGSVTRKRGLVLL